MKDNKKVTTLHKKYTAEKTLANIREQKRERLIRARKSAIVGIGTVALLVTSFPLIKNHRQTVEYRQQYEESKEKLSELKEKESELEYQVTLLENKDYVAKLARSEYHLTKDNEVIFKFPEVPTEEEKDNKEKDKNEDEKKEDKKDKEN